MSKVIRKSNGETVKEGDKIVDFRGEERTFIALTRGETRVYSKTTSGSFAQEHFPSVFPDLKIVED